MICSLCQVLVAGTKRWTKYFAEFERSYAPNAIWFKGNRFLRVTSGLGTFNVYYKESERDSGV
jgi:hypothetical protein